MELLNRIARSDPSLSIDASVVGSLSGHHHPAAGRVKATDRLDLAIGDGRLAVMFDSPTIVPLLRLAGIDDDAARRMEPDLAALVIEHLLEPWFEAAEELADRPVRIAGMFAEGMQPGEEDPADEWAATSFELSGDLWERSACLRVSAEREGGAAFLAAVCERLASAEPYRRAVDTGRIPVETVLASVPAAVPMGDLRVLGPGDALVFEDDWAIGSACTVTIGDRIRFDATRDPDGIRITGGLRPAPDPRDNPEETTEMSDDSDVRARLDAIPVTVSIELARIQIPMDEISRLVDGSVLPFSDKMPDRVRLLANGRVIANGELVRIDERVGVRILSVETGGDTATER